MRELVSSSNRYKLRAVAGRLRELINRACLWNWEVALLLRKGVGSCDIIYIGRKSQRDMAKAILNINQQPDGSSTIESGADRRVIVSEVPLPGAIRVPTFLGSRVRLGRPIEEITSNFHSQLRRELKKARSRYRLRQVLDNGEIERIDQTMLRPYAKARHGLGAAQISSDEVKKESQQYGRLDLLLFDDDEVGCQLSHSSIREGKSYWTANRFGYPDDVFSDPKRLRDINSMNNHLAMEWAIENGFDFYDIGGALGRPGDGLLEWKRRRGSELYTDSISGYFHIRLPKVGTPQFLWDKPLFAVEYHQLTLHLGLPDVQSDEEIASRYREMGFGGLFKVYLHCATPPSYHLLDEIRSYYAHQKVPPTVKVIVAV